jgi:hypothetical protein
VAKRRWEKTGWDEWRFIDVDGRILGRVERRKYPDDHWLACAEDKRDGSGTSIGEYISEQAAKAALEAWCKPKPKRRAKRG